MIIGSNYDYIISISGEITMQTSTKCRNCGKTIGYEEAFCSECADFLAATGKLSYPQLWKHKYSTGGCLGCDLIMTNKDSKCENCVRSHIPAPPFTDNYTKGGYL